MITTWSNLGNRVNPNLLTFPTAFDNAIWSKTGLTVTANQAVAPDGTTTMESVISAAVSGDHYIRRNNVGFAINKTYALSVFGKPSGYNFIDLRPLALTGAPRTVFNLSTGAVSSVGSGITSASIEAAANGSYRCSIIFTTSGVISPSDAIDISVFPTSTPGSYIGDGTSGVYLWGAKLELGGVATRFVP